MDKYKEKLVYGPPVKVKGVLGYSAIFERGTGFDGKEGKFSVKILIQKTDIATIKVIRDACALAVKKKFGDKPAPYSFESDPFAPDYRDGDMPNGEGKLYKAERGCYCITAKTNKKPGAVKVIGGVPHPLTEDELYSGSIIRVSLTPFVYTTGEGGVSFFFQIVRKLADGKRVSGYWECTKDKAGKVTIGKFVEGGVQEEKFDDEEDEYQEVDVKNEFDDDDTAGDIE